MDYMTRGHHNIERMLRELEHQNKIDRPEVVNQLESVS